jgi:hypothetical protein
MATFAGFVFVWLATWVAVWAAVTVIYAVDPA